MSEIKIFGHNEWPWCIPAKEFLLNKNIEFSYLNIRESEEANDEFKKVKDILINEKNYKGRVGVPTFVIGDDIIIGLDELKVTEALQKIGKIL